uniref:NADH-ubiquinone oxidoreductase chain 4 n=1 Tax=Omoglymmius wukong TaxID=2983420 RepID=A0A977TLH7_9CARA|nr:NADH dehydrogenase subunit 4 [Omoglymmius wukong]UXW93694.1 NADH dehydrogenase subunit 4 [Omoglymmius wukong]
MLKFLFMIIMLIPLSLSKNMYWMNQLYYFFMMFLFMYMYSMDYYMHVSYFMSIDMLSYGMILLSMWISVLMIMASMKVIESKMFSELFMFLLLFLLLMLFCTFSMMNMFLFYFFFEISLIPTLFLILGWGYQPERLQAGVYLLFYTLFASLPMMISIFYYYNNYYSLDFFFLNGLNSSILMFLCMMMAFLVKIPMFLVHLWLPKAHVEAPISGSMILAGVLLKLGGYGMIRILIMFKLICLKFSMVFISISMIGGILISLVCLRQIDIKSLIAYSSVSHMGMVLSGIMIMNYWGLYGSYMMMIAHGLCSSGLFCLANIVYERVMSRSLMLMKGLINLMPSMSLWWFLLCSSNMAAPPSLNLLGEISLLNSMMSYSWVLMINLMLMSFFSAVYTLFLYCYSQHGLIYSGKFSCSLGFIREYLLLVLHWLPLNLILFFDLMI